MFLEQCRFLLPNGGQKTLDQSITTSYTQLHALLTCWSGRLLRDSLTDAASSPLTNQMLRHKHTTLMMLGELRMELCLGKLIGSRRHQATTSVDGKEGCSKANALNDRTGLDNDKLPDSLLDAAGKCQGLDKYTVTKFTLRSPEHQVSGADA